MLASTARLLVVILGGLPLQAQQAPLGAMFMLIGAAMGVYGLGAMLAVRLTRRGHRPLPATSLSTRAI